MMSSPFRRTATALLVASVSLYLLLFTFSRAQAGPPPTAGHRFRWIEGVETLVPRQIPDRLSQPLSLRPVDVPLPDPSFAVDFAHYPTSAEVVVFLNQLEAAYPDLVEVTTAGQSWQGRPILAVRIGNEATGDPNRRSALYLDAQHHAREAVSAQVVLYFVWYLASRYGRDPLVTRLLDTRTVYVIPSVNPDGNDIFLSSDQRQRKTANPTASDDDADGQFDEDGREGAGYGSFDVYHFEFDPEWIAAHPDDPFADGWSGHVITRTFVGIFDGEGSQVPQTDDDADGQAGEDPPGGVDPNRNYDSHWESGNNDPRTEIYHGPAPFSEPESRAVRNLVDSHANIVMASSFHSGADLLLHPWGWSADADLPDRFWYEMLSRKGSQLTEVNGFRGTAHTWTARGLYAGSGSTMDWLYEQGILAWTPEVYGASSLAFTQRITTTNRYTVGLSVGEGFNPPPAEIPLTADRWLRWNLYLLAATPNVGLSGVEVGAGTLTMTVANDGLLPLAVEISLQAGQAVYTTTVASLSSAEQVWSAPFPSNPLTQTASITLTARSPIGTAASTPQVEVVKLEIAGEAVQVIEGRLEPFAALAEEFGGWWAGRQWDAPDVYHLGPALLRDLFLPFVGRVRP
ncbi:MAG: M14 family zinc carboxypeptidase [Anaerolineae bacterium]